MNHLEAVGNAALLLTLLFSTTLAAANELRGTGDLAVVVERAAGSVRILDTSARRWLGRVEGLGDLSHASVVFSRDQRYAYVFGRDGGLSRVDLLNRRLDRRIVQAGNSIGGAISQDGSLIAVSNYEPGGVRVFDAETLAPVADIPADYGSGGIRSKVVGLVDAPGQRFGFSLFDAGEIWTADFSQGADPGITRYRDIGRQPYDALITSDGRHYLAGLFGEDGLAKLDLWHPQAGVERILPDYGKGEEKLPVYKMPHLEGWALAGRLAFVPAVGQHQVLVIDTVDWREVARIPVHGQPVFVMARPDGRQVWVSFAHPRNDTVQVIDVPALAVVDTLEPGPAVLHMEFSPRGEQLWLSVRDADRIELYDTATRKRLTTLPADKPSGIFMTARAHRIGL
ncbi:MAG: cytochrome D1 domain-containing protein [Candidatus Competibacterales bacterium]|nr:cytochrome D1 domain-containing protein [Candidatus Competibacterales bacterium]